jgi:hypothetical protein
MATDRPGGVGESNARGSGTAPGARRGDLVPAGNERTRAAAVRETSAADRVLLRCEVAP